MSYEPQEGLDYIVNLYEVVGVDPQIGSTELRTVLNERTLEYHPDRLQGLAPEFQEKGERVARLLNRARETLLDPGKRTTYDAILAEWDGPVSDDGTPKITMERLIEAELQGKSSEEVEDLLSQQREQIISMVGYDPKRLEFLEDLIANSSGNVSEQLREQYEEALLQYDTALALEEVERSQLLGLPDISTHRNYTATQQYGEEISQAIETARQRKLDSLRFQSLGGVANRLALLAGEQVSPDSQQVIPVTTTELPSYYDEQTEKVKQIAKERERITSKRLDNLAPQYPEAELQTQYSTKLIVGVKSGDDLAWIALQLDRSDQSASALSLPENIQSKLDLGKYKDIIADGYGILTVSPRKHLDIWDIIGVAIGHYSEKYTD